MRAIPAFASGLLCRRRERDFTDTGGPSVAGSEPRFSIQRSTSRFHWHSRDAYREVCDLLDAALGTTLPASLADKVLIPRHCLGPP